MTGTKKIYIGIVSTISFVILTSCGSPVKNEKLTELQDAKAQLERNIAMYDETWKRFFEGETSIVNSERFQEDVVVVTAQGDIVGIEATKNYYLNFLTGFSNQEFTILEVVGQGNRLVKHWNFKGTHTGDFFGMPASGNKLNLSGTTMVTMKDGKIAKEQDFFDMMSMVSQLSAGDLNADETKAGVN
ncbi:MAG: SnoaL-like domain-containing protein [Candidatus Marinimicrobia bacterium]|jgi:hypothetical protein|nr:SnoaL-like domain-containing protein [Candidatus Neomarinimicrobiota bacterium]MBT7524332.1 SnoaL-like domain-containing protein [Candidatus Neomarinimicrobiota bacterium]